MVVSLIVMLFIFTKSPCLSFVWVQFFRNHPHARERFSEFGSLVFRFRVYISCTYDWNDLLNIHLAKMPKNG